jgi:hypothetical protein
MAEKTRETVTKNDAGAVPAGAIQAAAAPDLTISFDLPADYELIQDHRPMYTPAEIRDFAGGKFVPISGIMLGTMMLNPADSNIDEEKSPEEQMFASIVMRLNRPCLLRDNDKQIKAFPAGTECIIYGADLRSLHGAADDPKYAHEVCLVPDKQIPIGGGRRMWTYKKLVNPRKRDRAAENLYLTFKTGPSVAEKLLADRQAVAAMNAAGVPFDEDKTDKNLLPAANGRR